MSELSQTKHAMCLYMKRELSDNDKFENKTEKNMIVFF